MDRTGTAPGIADDTVPSMDAARQAFASATALSGTLERSYRLAERTIRFLFAGPAMAGRLTAAFEHLPPGDGRPTLTVRVWDAASTRTPAPPIPRVAIRDNTSPRFVYRSGPVRGIAQPVEGGLSLFDAISRQAAYWAVDAETVPYYESAAPIRHILSWWAGAERRPLVHAAAVGRPEGGLLLVGRGGSGKSTAALACLRSSLFYLGDDYALVEIDPAPVAHTLYGSGKLQPDNIDRLPELTAAISNRDRLPEEKAVLYVARSFPDRIVHRFPIRGVVVPRIAGAPAPRVEPVGAAVALAAMAPSTILQLPGTGQESLDAMARLLERVPAFSLSLSEDMAANVGALDDLIGTLGGP